MSSTTPILNPRETTTSPDRAALLLKIVLRIAGSVSMLALIAVFMPRSWMDFCNRGLGLGPLPEGPVFEYLARTISFLYATLGVLLWVLSGDLPRYRPVILAYGLANLVFGAVLIWIDWHLTAGLPLWWRAWEGPFVLTYSATVLMLSFRLPSGPRQ